MSLYPDYFSFKAREALASLLAYMKEAISLKNSEVLWSESRKVYVTIGFKESLKYKFKPVLIPLPHPIPNKEVCLILRDKRRQTLDRIKACKLPKMPTLITVVDLRTTYKTFDARRNLCGKYDAFLCDNKIYSRMYRLLGKKFEVYKKFPVPVDLSKKNLAKQFDRVFRSSTMCVGTSDMKSEDILSNVVHFADFLPRMFKDGLTSVQIIALKSQDSPALPIYKAGISDLCDRDDL
ncbi:hypothetical protein MXB_3990 [Myxobolus squamalis]|nr:hypothetical protein MXB_3990 [Myxobolus squamalis]